MSGSAIVESEISLKIHWQGSGNLRVIFPSAR